MDVTRVESLLFCVACVFLIRADGLKLGTNVLYDILSRIDYSMNEIKSMKTNVENIMNENKVLKSSLEGAVDAIEKQADLIIKLKKTIQNMKQQATEVLNLKNTMDKLGNKIEKLEDKNLENEKIFTEIENHVKISKSFQNEFNSLKNKIKEDNFSTNRKLETIREDTERESDFLLGSLLDIDDDFYEFKTRNEKMFANLTNDINFQISSMDTRVESQLVALKTFSENNFNAILNDCSKGMNKTVSIVKSDIRKIERKTERKLETLKKEMVTESDGLLTTLNEANENIQLLERRIIKVHDRQEQRVAFMARGGVKQGSGLLRFSTVYMNEGSVFGSSTGMFTCPFPGLYTFSSSITEYGSRDNYIYCHIKVNDVTYVSMISRQGKVYGTRTTEGYGTASGTATLNLNTGDSVYVWCNNRTESDFLYSVFSGFLINADM